MIISPCLLLIITINKGVINMNNLRKIGLSALAGSLATFSVNAADVSVSGGASISFDDTNRGKADRGNGFYMGDSLKFNMSGETDGGLGVAVYYEIDGGALDDHNIKLSGDWGSLTFDGHGGSSEFGAVDDKTPNAYEEAFDGLGTSAVVINGHSAKDMFHYTSESFSGAVLTASFVPAEATTSTGNKSTYMDFGVTYTPDMVEGLTLGYAMGTTEVTAGSEVDESTMYATYAIGGLTVGYQLSDYDASAATDSDDSVAIGISYQVNDDISVSYNEHTVDIGDSSTDQESEGISASYTMGGITIAGHSNEMKAVGGTSGTNDEGYEINLSFAF